MKRVMSLKGLLEFDEQAHLNRLAAETRWPVIILGINIFSKIDSEKLR